jgi:hypothetical protein
MEFPHTRAELLSGGYQPPTKLSTCKGCNQSIEWWKTPRGKSIPMQPMIYENSPATPHWQTCPNANDFRKAPPAQTQQQDVWKAGAYKDRPGEHSTPVEPEEIQDSDIPF